MEQANNANILSQDYYHYELYTEFINQQNKYLYNNQKNSLSIKYFHTRIRDDNGNFNFNYETGTRHSVNTAVQASPENVDANGSNGSNGSNGGTSSNGSNGGTSRNSNIYDIYEFTPTHNATSDTYQIDTDETGTTMITTGTISIFSICKPLPGDLFHYYTDAKGSTEVFKVTQVLFNKSTFDKENGNDGLKSGTLNLYELTYESSAIGYRTLNANIASGKTQTVDHNFFINEFDFYFTSVEFEQYKFLIINRDTILKEVNTFYDDIKCTYKSRNLSTIEAKIKNINSELYMTIKDTPEYFELSDLLETLIDYLDKLIQIDFKINNTIKFLNKNIPSFSSKVMPGFKLVLNEFKLIDRIIDSDLIIPPEIDELNLIDTSVLATKTKELYDNYYPFLHKVIIENDNKKLW